VRSCGSGIGCAQPQISADSFKRLVFCCQWSRQKINPNVGVPNNIYSFGSRVITCQRYKTAIVTTLADAARERFCRLAAQERGASKDVGRSSEGPDGRAKRSEACGCQSVVTIASL